MQKQEQKKEGNKNFNGNSTRKTQELILNLIKQKDKPISLFQISEEVKKSSYAVRDACEFLAKLNVVELIVSDAGQTLVKIKSQGFQNG